MSSEISRAVDNMHFFVPCKTNAVNKEPVSPLIRNNLLSKTALGKLYIMMIYIHLDAKKKISYQFVVS